MLKRTPFFDFHTSLGAKIVDFAGWEMPLLYRSIVDEHQHTRNSGGLFDVSHMGRLTFSGKDTLKFLDLVTSRDLKPTEVGQCKYALVCNEQGGTMDDVIVSRDVKQWNMVCNASNREKLVKHFQNIRRTRDLDFDMSDQTEATAMIALQGPKAIEKVSGILPTDFTALKRWRFESSSYMLIKFTVYRTGYTGEDGVELVLPAKMAGMAMKMIGGRFEKENATLKPAGLGARDTLRIEAGLPLYGHELSEEIDPITAALGFAVSLDKDFIGADALRALKPARMLVGLELDGKRIARQGCSIVDKSGTVVGIVSSGTMSPTLNKSIAMAFVDVGHTAVGTELAADLSGTHHPCKVVPLPFYKRAK